MVLWVLFVAVVAFGIWFYMSKPFEKIADFGFRISSIDSINEDRKDESPESLVGTNPITNQVANDKKSDKEMNCSNDGGVWYTDDNTCEVNSLSESECKAKSGEYNECASACRHEPNATVCTMQCVVTCSFK